MVGKSTSAGRPVTVTDVARAAGVAPGTASKALNGKGSLRRDTRDRVLAAAKALGFVPNALARSLTAGRTYTVGLISTDSISRFAGQVAYGAENVLGEGEVSVFLCDGRGDPVRERHYLRILMERRVDGLIVTGRRHEPRPPIAEELQIPVVYALSPSENPSDTSFVVDDLQGGRLAAEHLVRLGRRNIAIVTGPERHLSARLRATAGVEVLAKAGLPVAGGTPFWGEWTERWGGEATRSLLSGGVELDGIVCGSDQIARGVVDALREAGVVVPSEISVIGFDNWDVMVDGSRPALTTIDMNLVDLGRHAARALLDAIEADMLQPGVHDLPCHLVMRESASARSPGR
jgi:LacI family transcriptional regulator